MSEHWDFYHTTNNPTGFTTTVGGAISTTLLAGNLNELFTFVNAPPSGTQTAAFQYRKIHIRNSSVVTLTGVRTWIDAVEHDEQVAIGIESGSAETTTNATTAPATVEFFQPITYGTGLHIDTLGATFSTGLWIRQRLSGIDEPDPYASLRVNVAGLD